MGYAIVHMQKVKKSGLRGIQSHMNREHDSKTNPDIDTTRTADNYHIIHQQNLHQAVKETMDDYLYSAKAVRKDAVHLCCFIVTSDEQTMKDMPPHVRERFFEDSVDFFRRRYGREFVQFATVHNDETTPHLHIGIVPAARCKDSDSYKLSAKELFNPKELKALQTAFYEQVGKRYGLERGQENSQAKHLTEMQYKAHKASEKVMELEAKLPALQEQISEMEYTISAMDRAIKEKDEKGRALYGFQWKDRIASIREQDRKELLLSLFQKFVELPFIKPHWEAFLNEHHREKSKEKKKNAKEWGE